MPTDNKKIKTKDLFTALAEELDRVAKSITEGGKGDYAIPPTEDIEELLKKIDKEFCDPKKLERSDFVIKKDNELCFVGMFLKAVKVLDRTGMEDRLSSLSKITALGDKEKGFINNGYKELLKRLT